LSQFEPVRQAVRKGRHKGFIAHTRPLLIDGWKKKNRHLKSSGQAAWPANAVALCPGCLIFKHNKYK
jgi:hypothetical protein